MQRWGDARTHLEVEWKWAFFSLGLLCAAHMLAFGHTALHIKYVSEKEEGVKNSYETHELNFGGGKYHKLFSHLQSLIRYN